MEQSVASLFEVYLERSDLRPASVDIKRRACRYFLRWFGDPPVGAVDSATAEDYRTLLGRGRSAVTVNGYLENFRPFWVWLLRRGYITSNPFAMVRSVRVDERPPKQTFTPGELEALMSVADDLWRLRIALGLMGARRGEVLASQGRDYQPDPPCPHILLGWKASGKRTLPWGCKGRRLRYIAVPERMGFQHVIVPVRQLLADRVAAVGPDGYVCLSDDRTQLLRHHLEQGSLTYAHMTDPAGNFARSFRLLQERAGIVQTRRFHELRAAFTTRMIDAFGLSRAADLVGHVSVNQTRQYDRKDRLSLVADAARIAEHVYISAG